MDRGGPAEVRLGMHSWFAPPRIRQFSVLLAFCAAALEQGGLSFCPSQIATAAGKDEAA